MCFFGDTPLCLIIISNEWKWAVSSCDSEKPHLFLGNHLADVLFRRLSGIISFEIVSKGSPVISLSYQKWLSLVNLMLIEYEEEQLRMKMVVEKVSKWTLVNIILPTNLTNECETYWSSFLLMNKKSRQKN